MREGVGGGARSLKVEGKVRAPVHRWHICLAFTVGGHEGGQLPEISGSVGLSSFQKFPSQTGSLGLARMALSLY